MPAGLLIAMRCASSNTTEIDEDAAEEEAVADEEDARSEAAAACCFEDLERFFCSFRRCVFVTVGAMVDDGGGALARARCFCARLFLDMAVCARPRARTFGVVASTHQSRQRIKAGAAQDQGGTKCTHHRFTYSLYHNSRLTLASSERP